MFVFKLASLAIAAAALLGQSVIAAKKGCVKPAVRREWRSLTAGERADWINAVKCLAKVPHNPSLVPTFNTTYAAIPPINETSSYFDDFVYVHMDLNRLIHFTGQFLPWHRAYVQDFETALKEKCGFKGTQPYWDWTLDASNYQNTSFWDPDLTSGIGGWGDPNDDYQITSGGFFDDFIVSYPVPHRVRRQYTPFNDQGVFLPNRFTPESQVAMVQGSIGNFVGFQYSFEPMSHGAVHRATGGDLFGGCPAGSPAGCVAGPKWSPNDPLFMLHHGMIDKLWYDWQKAHTSNWWSFTGGSVQVVVNFQPSPTYPNGDAPMMNFSTPIPTDGILNEYTVYELMHTTNERLCYVYEESGI